MTVQASPAIHFALRAAAPSPLVADGDHNIDQNIGHGPGWSLELGAATSHSLDTSADWNSFALTVLLPDM